MTKPELENATLEAIYWWNRDEHFYHKYFSKLDEIYNDKAILPFFTGKVFEVFLREYAVRRNLSAGCQSVDSFINELFKYNFVDEVKQGNIEIIDELSLKLKESGESTDRQTKSLLSKVAFLINPSDFVLYDSQAKQSLRNIYKNNNQVRSADLEFYSKFIKQIYDFRSEIIENKLFAESKIILNQFEKTDAYTFFSKHEQAFEMRIIDKHLWQLGVNPDGRVVDNLGYYNFYKLQN